jgi:hypothetical protein
MQEAASRVRCPHRDPEASAAVDRLQLRGTRGEAPLDSLEARLQAIGVSALAFELVLQLLDRALALAGALLILADQMLVFADAVLMLAGERLETRLETIAIGASVFELEL